MFFFLLFRYSCGLESNSFIDSIDSEGEIAGNCMRIFLGMSRFSGKEKKKSNGKMKRNLFMEVNYRRHFITKIDWKLLGFSKNGADLFSKYFKTLQLDDGINASK